MQFRIDSISPTALDDWHSRLRLLPTLPIKGTSKENDNEDQNTSKGWDRGRWQPLRAADHNEAMKVRSAVKAGVIGRPNHNETLKVLKVRTTLKAGSLFSSIGR